MGYHFSTLFPVSPLAEATACLIAKGIQHVVQSGGSAVAAKIKQKL